MLGSFQIAEVRGVPIRIHFTVFLMLFVFGGFGPLWTLFFSAVVLLSVALHELGHTVVSQRYEIDVRDIILTPVGGVARLVGMAEDPRHEIRIALAGPYVSFLLALTGALLAGLSFWIRSPLLFTASLYFAGINLALFLFNLLPSFPMDGGRVLRGWLAQKKGMLEATRIASTTGKYMSIAFIVYGLLAGMTNLAIIGLFILFAAGSEYRMIQVKTWREQHFGGTTGPQPVPETEFIAGPPPYAASEKPKRQLDGLAGDALQAARDLFEEILGHIKK